MTTHHPPRQRGRGDWIRPAGATADYHLDDDGCEAKIDLDAIYEKSLDELDADWLDRYGEESWYAAITLSGLFWCGDDTPLEEIPEEYRWRGTSHRYPTASAPPSDGGR